MASTTFGPSWASLQWSGQPSVENFIALTRIAVLGAQADAHLGGGRGRAVPARVWVQPLRALAQVSPAPDRLRAHAGQLPARAVRV